MSQRLEQLSGAEFTGVELTSQWTRNECTSITDRVGLSGTCGTQTSRPLHAHIKVDIVEVPLAGVDQGTLEIRFFKAIKQPEAEVSLKGSTSAKGA